MLYIPGGLRVLWVLLDGSIYLSVMFECVSFPIGVCAISALAGYFSRGSICPGYVSLSQQIILWWCSRALLTCARLPGGFICPGYMSICQ